MNWSVVRESVKKYGMRNSNCLAIAPTATISNIAGCFPCIEPAYKNMYVKSNMSGEFIVNNNYLIEDLKQLGLWNQEMLEEIKRHDGSIQNIEVIPRHVRDKYKETFDIDPEWLIKLAAARGKWIDQSQSLNIFMKGTSGKKISDVYQLAWKSGLKTTYYLRSLAASSVEKSTLDIKKQESALRSSTLTDDVTTATSIDAPAVTRETAQPQAEPMVMARGKASTVETVQTIGFRVPETVSVAVAETPANSTTGATPSPIATAPSSLTTVADPECEVCQ